MNMPSSFEFLFFFEKKFCSFIVMNPYFDGYVFKKKEKEKENTFFNKLLLNLYFDKC